MNIFTISFTDNGRILENKVHESLNGEKVFKFSNRSEVEDVFQNADVIIFISAIGIAVRFIAPFIKSKDSDPAVIVLDEHGKYIIPILSGHLGGANRFALQLADTLKAECVITSATDINNVFAIDIWAKDNNCSILDIKAIKSVSSKLLRGGTVGFFSDYGVVGELPSGFLSNLNSEVGVAISKRVPFPITLRVLPKVYVLGIGCRRGIAFDILKSFVLSTLADNNIDISEVSNIATIDIKSDEVALNELGKVLNLPIVRFTAEELSVVGGEFLSSSFVKRSVGVDNVCERACVKANDGKLVVGKVTSNGVALAISKAEWVCKF